MTATRFQCRNKREISNNFRRSRYSFNMPSRCSVEDCEKWAQNAGVLCRTHWREKSGIPCGKGGKKSTQKGLTCKGPECDREAHSKGYCKAHYWQLRNKGRVWVLGSRQGRAAYATCIVYACGAPTVQWGYCDAHVDEWLGRCVIHWCNEPIRYKRLGLCDTHARQNRWFSHKYGITISERYLLAEKQNHQCATCAAPDEKGVLHVDHCHDTGKVRGMLCGNCNRAIGLFNHAPAALRAAADYLERAHGLD